MTRKIVCLIIHCSDSDQKAHDNPGVINEWHIQRGFKGIGYHFFVDKSGRVHPGRDESTIGAHTKGHNAQSIGICLSGRHEFTQEQFTALGKLCLELTRKYGLDKKDILGHCELDQTGKTCPNFDVHALVSSWDWH